MSSSPSNNNSNNNSTKHHHHQQQRHHPLSNKTNVTLGSDAASSYYFSNVPKTPAVTTAKKKIDKEKRKSYIRQSKKKNKNDNKDKENQYDDKGNDDKGNKVEKLVNEERQQQKDGIGTETPSNNNIIIHNNDDNNNNNNTTEYSIDLKLLDSIMKSTTKPLKNDDTTKLQTTSFHHEDESSTASLLISFQDIHSSNISSGGSSSSSIKKKQRRSSIHSIQSTGSSNASATTSSGNNTSKDNDDEEEDTLNKSVLSDTTELTASNFVFAAQAKHRLSLFNTEQLQSLKKMQQKIMKKKNEDENDEKREEKDSNDNDTTMDFLQEFFHNDLEDTEEYDGGDVQQVLMKKKRHNFDQQVGVTETLNDDDDDCDHDLKDNDDKEKDVCREQVKENPPHETIVESTSILQSSFSTKSHDEDSCIEHENNNDSNNLSQQPVLTMSTTKDLIIHDDITANDNLNKSTTSSRLSLSSPSLSMLQLREKAANARRLTFSLQRRKKQRESEKKESRRRISTGGFALHPGGGRAGSIGRNRLSLPSANVTLPIFQYNHDNKKEEEDNNKNASDHMQQNIGNLKVPSMESSSNRAVNMDQTFDGGHTQLNVILGNLVDNKDHESDESSEVSSIDGKLDMSILKSPTMGHTEKVNYTPQEAIAEESDADSASFDERSGGDIEDTSKVQSDDIADVGRGDETATSIPSFLVSKSPVIKCGSSPAARVYLPSPARNTRSSTKKRKSSIGAMNSTETLSVVSKKINLSTTPEKLESVHTLDHGSRSKSGDRATPLRLIYENAATETDSEISNHCPETTDSMKVSDSYSTSDDTADFVGFVNVNWEPISQMRRDELMERSNVEETDKEDKNEETSIKESEMITSEKKQEEASLCSNDRDDNNTLFTLGSMKSIQVDNETPVSPLQPASEHKRKAENEPMSTSPSDVSITKDHSVTSSNRSTRESKRRFLEKLDSNSGSRSQLLETMSNLSLPSPTTFNTETSNNDEDTNTDLHSNGSDDNVSCGSDTANTMDLQDIMAALNHPLKMKEKEKDPRKSLSGHSDMVSDESNYFTSESAANTQDIKGLLNGLGLKESTYDTGTSNASLHTIEESKNLDDDNSEDEIVLHQESNSNDIETTSPITNKQETFSKQQIDVGNEKKPAPKSILNSFRKNKKVGTPKKSVLFYPPIAAEYNIGSPPMSLTPMCKKKARSLYQIPSFGKEATDLSPDIEDSNLLAASSSISATNAPLENDNTVDVSGGHTDDSNSCSDMSEGVTITINLESNLEGVLNAVNGDNTKSFERDSNGSISISKDSLPHINGSSMKPNSSLKSSNDSGEDVTINLESDLKGLLNEVQGNKSGLMTSKEEDIDINTSLDASDSLSLGDYINQHNTDGDTVTMNLESDLKELLHGVDSNCNNVDSKILARDNRAGRKHDKPDEASSIIQNKSDCESSTMPLESNFHGTLNGDACEGSEVIAGDSKQLSTNCDIDHTDTISLGDCIIQQTSDSKNVTMNLESNLQGLLDGVERDKLENVEVDSYLSETSSLRVQTDHKTTFDNMTGTATLEADLNGLLNGVNEIYRSNSLQENNTSDDMDESETLSFKQSIVQVENNEVSNTLTLESDLEGLLNGVERKCPESSRKGRESFSSILDSRSVGSKGETLSAILRLGSTSSTDHDSSFEKDKKRNDNDVSVSKSLKYSISHDATTLESKLHGLMNDIEIDKSSRSNFGIQDSIHESEVSRMTKNSSFSFDKARFAESDTETPRDKSIAKDRTLKSRRSSRRVSLIPTNISSHEIEDEAHNLDHEVVNSEINFSNNEHEVITPDITWYEFCNAIPHLFHGSQQRDSCDILLDEVQSALIQCTHTSINDQINTFLMNVCEKMERDANEDTDTSEMYFADVIANNSLDMLKLQQILRSDPIENLSIETRQVLQRLGDSISSSITQEFKEWEIQVINALLSRVGSMESDVIEDKAALQRHVTLTDDVQHSLRLLSQEAVRMARTKSITKKRKQSSSLEDEIGEIERSINEAERELESTRNMQSSFTEKSNVVKDQETIRRQLSDIVALAERNYGKLRSIEGVTNWRVKQLEDSIISIDLKDRNIPELGVSITFKGLSDDNDCKMICHTQIRNDSSSVRKKYNLRTANYSDNVRAYVEYCLRKMCEEVNNGTLNSSSDMYHVINHMEWTLGRLALVGKELSFLERRYGGSVQRDVNDTSSFTLDVKIDTKQGDKVGAYFYICEAYPFAVLDVELDVLGNSDINVDSLERQLAKTSKPGFGYLSRSCDIISCFVN